MIFLWIKQTSFLLPCPSTLGQYLPHGCIKDILKKIHKISILNIELFMTHTVLELGMPYIAGKLAKYVIQPWW
jgi:hypothetical protein